MIPLYFTFFHPIIKLYGFILHKNIIIIYNNLPYRTGQKKEVKLITKTEKKKNTFLASNHSQEL
ncbi:hypothetical protein CsatB_024202 [Cannabis sativa]